MHHKRVVVHHLPVVKYTLGERLSAGRFPQISSESYIKDILCESRRALVCKIFIYNIFESISCTLVAIVWKYLRIIPRTLRSENKIIANKQLEKINEPKETEKRFS